MELPVKQSRENEFRAVIEQIRLALAKARSAAAKAGRLRRGADIRNQPAKIDF